MGRQASLASHAIDGARRQPTEFCDLFGSDKGFHLSQYCLATGPEAEDRIPVPDYAGINIVLGTQANV
jgi:hypothetical protein